MNSNDPRDEAMLELASAIQHISADAKSRELAERAEVFILGAKLIEEFAALRNNIAAEIERLNRIQEANEWMKEHMPKSVSTFGGSDGVFGWVGTDADGNRVTWKVEPPAAADEGSLPAAIPEKEMLRQCSASTVHALHQVLISAIEKYGLDEQTATQAANAFRAGLAAFDAPNRVP